MKASYNILQSLISKPLPEPKGLIELLTMHSFETVIERQFVIDEKITIAKILKLEKHPGADRLRLATITTGEEELTVVCGAPNISEGDIVPYAPPGSKVYDAHGEFFTLTVAKIRGIESAGMLNSARELGLSDNHGGILLLPKDTPIGSKLAEYIPSDTILDIDVLPDRQGDAGTHVGIAREIGALMQVAIKQPEQISEIQSLYMQVVGVAEIGEVENSEVVHTIAFNPNAPAKVAGISINYENVKMHLERLGFVVKGKDDAWEVGVPAYRKDVLGQHDLVDEVVRLHGDGLDAIPASDIVKTFNPIPVSEKVYWERQIRNLFVELGFTETYSYSFEDEKVSKLINSDIHPHVELVNPMAPELKNMRYSMLSGLIGAMMQSKDEMHRAKDGVERALFEIGRVYHRGDDGVVAGIIERPVISGIAVGDESTLQEITDKIRALFGIESITVHPAEKPFAHINRLEYAGEFFGMMYVFNKTLLQKMKFRMPVVAFEISFNALMKHAPDVEIPVKTLADLRADNQNPTQFTELPKFPSVFRDISMLVAIDASIDHIEQEINRVGGELVVDVDLFDEFVLPLPEGELEGVGGARKSLAFHIEYRSKERTLTDAEILEVHKNIEHAISKQFEAEIR
ncbi:MAG: phenylalanine--tRNA ligase subunit beta [Candidatus Andersenbacteria bacterium]